MQQVLFENGKTQTITHEITASGSTLNAIVQSSHWILNLSGTATFTSPLPYSIAWCESASFLNWSTSDVTDGLNNINVFTSVNIYIWTGTTNTTWTNGGNWQGGLIPPDGDSTCVITILSTATYFPVFSSAGTGLQCNTLRIQAGASLNMGSFNLDLNELENDGTLILAGTSSQTVNMVVTSNAGNVTYNATIPADGVSFAGLTNFKNLTIVNGARNLGTVIVNVNGNFRLEADSLNATSINVTGTSFIAGNITTSVTQTYTGAVTLGGSGAVVNAGTGTVTLGNITGAGNPLSVTASTATFNGGIGIGALSVTGDAVFQAATLNATSVTVSLTSTISADVTTSGTQTYSAVTLGGTAALNAGTGTVTLGSITGGNNSLSVTASTAIFNGGSGIGALSVTGDAVFQTATLSATSVSVSQASTISADVTTSGAQIYSTVILGGIAALNAGAGTVALGNITGGNNSLSVTASTATFNGGSGIDNLYVNGNFELASGSLNIETININGTSDIAGDVTTTGVDSSPNYAQYYNGAVTLSSDVIFTGLTNSTVYFNSTVNGNAAPTKNLTITTANVIFNGAVGTLSTSFIESVTVDTGAVAINADIATTGNQDYGSGTVTTTGTRTLTSTVGDIVAAGNVNGTNVTLNAGGVVTIGTLSVTSNTIINAGGNIKLANITGGVFTLNAGYPNHTSSGNPGKVELTNITVTDITIWCEELYSYNSLNDNTAVDVEINTDDDVGKGQNFLDTFSSISGSTINKLRHSPPVGITILYSFTEDVNKNGKLDRIRVQTDATDLTTYIPNLSVTVSGYEIDIINHPPNGLALENTGTDKDSFYIYLIEKTEYDGSVKPSINISLPGNVQINQANIKYIDTIPPRIMYTLTLPEHSETYVQMTEPVKDSLGGTVSASFGGVSVNASPQSTTTSYLFVHSTISYGVSDIANLSITLSATATGYFQMTNVVDNELPPSGTNPTHPPKYPVDWGYTAYADDTNPSALKPPNKLQGALYQDNTPANDTVTLPRRVTDVLVSMPPNAANNNYFAFPMWAKPSNGYSSITQFDGTAYLEKDIIEEKGIELQARTGNGLSSKITALELYWTTAVIPADKRNPKQASEAKKVGGLWLPNLGNSPNYDYVQLSNGINPKPSTSSTIIPPPENASLFNYDIGANALANSGGIFEFIFHDSSSDMFIARLDTQSGVLPSNWYTLIRPFSFNIQGKRYQRGGVTILNNVINSDKRENTIIRYELARPGRVTVQIYTLDGTSVKSVRRNEQREAGTYEDRWDGSNNGGRAVARGMYFVRVVGPDIDEIRKIMVVK